MGGFSQYGRQQDEGVHWRPALIAAVVIGIMGVVIWLLSRGAPPPPREAALDPYAASVQVSDLRLSTVENFVGGQVTYLEGKIGNTGGRTVTGAQVETVFRNTLGEVVDRQTQPLRVAASTLGHADWVGLSAAPLAPGGIASFRLAFEHISADWNRGYPELRFVQVATH